MTTGSTLLKKSAFHKSEYSAVFFNSTSQTDLTATERIKIIELGDDWLSLEVPRTSCAQGHKLLLHVMPKNDVKKLNRKQLRTQIPFAISITANVDEYTPLSDEVCLVRLNFTQFVKTEWGDFLQKWKSIQDNVDKQFKEIKE